MKQNSSQGIRGGSRCLDRWVGVGIGTIMVSTEVLSPRLVVRWVVVGIGTIMASTGVLSLRVAVRWVGVGIGTIMVSTGVLSLRLTVRWVGGWNRYYYGKYWSTKSTCSC